MPSLNYGNYFHTFSVKTDLKIWNCNNTTSVAICEAAPFLSPTAATATLVTGKVNSVEQDICRR